MVEGTGNDFIWLMGHFSFAQVTSRLARCDKKKLITDPKSSFQCGYTYARSAATSPGDSFKRWEYVGWLCVTYLSPFMALLHPFPLFSWRCVLMRWAGGPMPTGIYPEIATMPPAVMTERKHTLGGQKAKIYLILLTQSFTILRNLIKFKKIVPLNLNTKYSNNCFTRLYFLFEIGIRC